MLSIQHYYLIFNKVTALNLGKLNYLCRNSEIQLIIYL